MWLDSFRVFEIGKVCFGGILEDWKLRVRLLESNKSDKEDGGIKLVDNKNKKQSIISFIKIK